MRRQHRHDQPNRRFNRLATAAATVAIAAALIAVGAPAASAAPREIKVEGIITGFTPKAIEVAAGEEVSICLTSPDTDHDLTIPTAKNFQVVAPTGPAVCKTLTAPTKAGTHKTLCSIPGHASAGMVGTLVVAAAGAAAPTAPAATKAGPAPAAGVQPAGSASDGVTLSPLLLGGGLLVVAMLSALLGWKVAHKD